MKLLYFTYNLKSKDFSGLPTYSESFIKNFKDKMELIVVNVIANPQEKDRIESENNWHNCYCSNIFGAYYPNVEELIGKIVQEHNPDYVLLQDYIMEKYMEQFYKVQPFQKILFVHLCQRGLMDSFTKQPFFDVFMAQGMADLSNKCWLEWKSIRTSNIIITNSEFTTDELKKYYEEELEYGQKIITAPLGIDVDKVPFQPCFEGKKWAYFGRLDAQKGLNYIIRDFTNFPELYKENPLIVIGDGTMDNSFIKADFFDGYVKYKGLLNKEDLYKELKDVKYCIFPSIYEPWGLALTEALAMGKICFISATGGGMHEQVYYYVDSLKQKIYSKKYPKIPYSIVNGFVIDFRSNSIITHINAIDQDITKEIFDKITNNSRELARKESDHFNLLNILMENKNAESTSIPK